MLERLDKVDKTDLLYSPIKRLSNVNRLGHAVGAVRNVPGKILTEETKIQDRWKVYVEELYDKRGRPSMDDFQMEEESCVGVDDVGPELMEEEIIMAIKGLKENKAEGGDGMKSLQNFGKA